MSRYPVQGGRNRFDSALDLSHNHRYSSQEDFEDAQAVPAGSVIAPWSEYNTRSQPEHTPPYARSVQYPNPYPTSTLAPTDYTRQAFEGGFSPADPCPRFASPDTTIFSSCSPPISPSPRPLDVGASNATALWISPTGDNNTIRCAQCSQVFTGAYREGNLARHTRHTHTNGRQYPCTADGCSKIFRRQDARLKHARKRHPELHLPPVQRRHGTEHDSASYVYEDVHVSQDLNYKIGQWSKGNQASSGSSTSIVQHELPASTAVEQLPDTAHYVWETLKAQLDPSHYSRICDSFFTRWESIIQQLWDDHSDAYHVYTKVLDDIRAVVYAVDNAESSSAAGPSGYSSRASQSQRPRPRGNGTPNLGYGTGITSQTDRVSKHKQSTTSASGKNVIVATDDIANVDEHKEVDCPIYKHHLMHGTTPTCQGCRETVMSQVRSHLNRAAGSHGGFPRFVQQCCRCKRDFVERRTYDDHRSANTCVHRRQIRGDIAVPWARQYLALYPDAQRIPLPWLDERGWLPNHVVAQCRESSFLGLHPQTSPQPQAPLPLLNPPDIPVYIDAATHVLQELLNPTFMQSAYSSTAVRNHNRHNTAIQQALATGASDSNNQYWQSVLYSFIVQQRTMHQAAAHLSEAQLRVMTEECEQMLNFSRTLSGQHQPQPAQTQTHSGTIYEDLPSNPVHTTPMRSQYGQLATPDASDQFITPSTSTLPSNRSYGAFSSQNRSSTRTDPSSTYNPNLLSPYSPTAHRRTSLPNGVNQDALRLRPLPSRRSLPDNADDCIDPSLLNSPSDDNDAPYYDITRHF